MKQEFKSFLESEYDYTEQNYINGGRVLKGRKVVIESMRDSWEDEYLTFLMFFKVFCEY